MTLHMLTTKYVNLEGIFHSLYFAFELENGVGMSPKRCSFPDIKKSKNTS